MIAPIILLEVGPHWVNVAEIAAVTVGQVDHPPSGTVRFDMHVVLRSWRRVSCSWRGNPVQRQDGVVWPQREERDAAVAALLQRMAFEAGVPTEVGDRLFEVSP